MARFTADTINNYGGSGGAGYFSLKNDRDIATVRFLYNTPDDVDGFSVHEVEIDGKKRYVNCLRTYDQPIDDCPFCKAHRLQIAKVFIPLYNEDTGRVQVWERGRKFFNKLSSVLSRCDADPICSQTFEIERNGVKGDKDTTYEIYTTKSRPDDKILDDFEMPDILGSVVLDKSADDMEFYLDNGYFPPEGESVRRSANRREEVPERRESRRSRRTPANNEDVY